METLKEIGKIIAVDQSRVTIQVQAGVQECHACAMAYLCNGDGGPAKTLNVPREQLDFEPRSGQQVEVSFNKVLEFSMLVYLLPILCFLTALIISNLALNISGEFTLFLSGLLGLVAGFFALWFVNKLVNKKGLNVKINLCGES